MRTGVPGKPVAGLLGLRRIATAIALAVAALFLLAYAADWIQLQVRERRGSAYGSMLVVHTEAVREKGGKVEYFSDEPQPTSCVHTIFPHEGEPPCWWLARHIDEQQSLN